MSSGFSGSRQAGSAVQPCANGTSRQPLHWIEIELVGEDGKAVPWMEYQVKLPDATVATGYLDRNGFARIDSIPLPGTCAICFPELDAEAWTFVKSLPSPRGDERQEES